MGEAFIWFALGAIVAVGVIVDIARCVAGKGSVFDPPAVRMSRDILEDHKRRWGKP